jgi:hypothetical protein
MRTETRGVTMGTHCGGKTHNHLCYHCVVAKVKFKTIRTELRKLQRLAYFGITGVVRMTLRATIKGSSDSLHSN